jgi:hypothetical protein
MLKERFTAETREGAPGEELARITGQFADGLHALAQPLTILRSALAASTMPQLSLADRSRYLETSAAQIENACLVFHQLRELVAVQQDPAQRERIDTALLLHHFCEAERPALLEAGVNLTMVCPDRVPDFVGDMDRMLQALFAAVQVASRHALPGDIIELRASSGSGWVEISVVKSGGLASSLKSGERLTLAIAEANVRSQQGSYDFQEAPWRIAFTLPAYGAGD